MGLQESKARAGAAKTTTTTTTNPGGAAGADLPPKEKEEAAREYVHKEPVGVVVIGLGQRMRTLLRFLLLKHSRLVHIRAICDESPEAIRQGLEHLKYTPRPPPSLKIPISFHFKFVKN
jgi:hypothetical protein